jgi:hypothetical protein
VAATVADLEARAARALAREEQLRAELDAERRQREPVEPAPPTRTPRVAHWVKTGEQRSGITVIDPLKPVEEETRPEAISVADVSEETRAPGRARRADQIEKRRYR